MADNDTVHISISGPEAVATELHRALLARTTAVRAQGAAGWWVRLDDLLHAAVTGVDIPGPGDPQGPARALLVRFASPRERGHEFGPAAVEVAGEILGGDGDRLADCLRTLTLRYPVFALMRIAHGRAGETATLCHRGAEYTPDDGAAIPTPGPSQPRSRSGSRRRPPGRAASPPRDKRGAPADHPG